MRLVYVSHIFSIMKLSWVLVGAVEVSQLAFGVYAVAATDTLMDGGQLSLMASSCMAC